MSLLLTSFVVPSIIQYIYKKLRGINFTFYVNNLAIYLYENIKLYIDSYTEIKLYTFMKREREREREREKEREKERERE